MSKSTLATTDQPEESERIRLWREERARIAEEGKKERLRLAAEEKERQQVEETERQRREAEALLPDDAELARIADDLNRHRIRRKSRFALQLAAFVAAPVLAVAGYLAFIAVPLFEATAVIAITRDTHQMEQGGSGAFRLAGRLAPAPELYMAHEYVQSGSMMDLLEDEIGLVETLSGPEMDPIFRIRDIPAAHIDSYQGFQRFVDASIDVQSGLMTLRIRTPDPQQSIEAAEIALLETERRIADLNAATFSERMAQSEAAVETARAMLATAQAELTRVQIQSRETDPRQRIDGIYARIEELEAEADRVEGDIARAEIAGQSKAYRTEHLVQLNARLDEQIDALRNTLVGTEDAAETALNAQLIRHEQAALELRIAEEALADAQRSLSATREDAASRMSVFQIVVPPQSATTPTHPNLPAGIFLTLLLALCAFGAVKMFLPHRAV